MICYLFFQRSAFSEYHAISSHQFKVPALKERPERNATSTFVAAVSNWGWVRDTVAEKTSPRCTIGDFAVSLKLACTNFERVKSDVGDSVGSVSSVDEESESEYSFDRNGAIIPYAAFVSLMKTDDFTDAFISDVKANYERVEGSMSCPEAEKEKIDHLLDSGAGNDVQVEKDDEDEIGGPKKSAKKRILVESESESDEDDEGEGEEEEDEPEEAGERMREGGRQAGGRAVEDNFQTPKRGGKKVTRGRGGRKKAG